MSAAHLPPSPLGDSSVPTRRDRDDQDRNPRGEGRGQRSTVSGFGPASRGAQVGSGGEARRRWPRLPAAKWSGVDFLPAVSRLFTFSGVTSLLTRSTSPLRHASNSSRAAGSTASAAAPAQAAPPPAQRRPDMILAAAAASSSASNGSRSPGPASRRARPPGGEALRARAARIPAVTGLGAVPWPRRRAPLARPRDPGCPAAAAEATRTRLSTPEATRRRKLARPLLPAPLSPGSARDVTLRVRSGRRGPGRFRRAGRRGGVCGKCEARASSFGRRGGLRPTAIFVVGFAEVERLCLSSFLKNGFPDLNFIITLKRTLESFSPILHIILDFFCGKFPFFQLPQSLSPGGFSSVSLVCLYTPPPIPTVSSLPPRLLFCCFLWATSRK